MDDREEHFKDHEENWRDDERTKREETAKENMPVETDLRDLETDRYKTCSFRYSVYDREGELEAVECNHPKSTGLCGDQPCPITDVIDEAEYQHGDR